MTMVKERRTAVMDFNRVTRS